jgi:hypothetical protein
MPELAKWPEWGHHQSFSSIATNFRNGSKPVKLIEFGP